MSSLPQITKEEYQKCYQECLTKLREHEDTDFDEFFIKEAEDAERWFNYFWRAYNVPYCPSFDEPSGSNKKFAISECKKYACISKAYDKAYDVICEEKIKKYKAKKNAK